MEDEWDAVRIKVRKLNPAAQLPRYAHDGAVWRSGCGFIRGSRGDTGGGCDDARWRQVSRWSFRATHGALVEDRSGLAVRGVTTLAGVIDPGYRGEIKVVMTNLSGAAVEIKAGDRIAQLRIVQRIEAEFEEVSELAEASRGAKGFGSTGS